MRRVVLAIASTAAVLVLLLSFKSHTSTSALAPAAVAPNPNPAPSSSTPAGGSPPSGSPAAPAATASSSGTSSGGTPAGGKAVTGDAVETIYGPVQVKITVANGKVTAAEAIEYPDGTPRDYQINSYAIPMLQQETVGVSSPNIDAVSGATYTSQGYIGSLQSALDKAGL
jgi:uncharacterized protein with FMN-binding domain